MNIDEISKKKPLQAYADGYKKGQDETKQAFWEILKNMYDDGTLKDADIKRFFTLKTL